MNSDVQREDEDEWPATKEGRDRWLMFLGACAVVLLVALAAAASPAFEEYLLGFFN